MAKRGHIIPAKSGRTRMAEVAAGLIMSDSCRWVELDAQRDELPARTVGMASSLDQLAFKPTPEQVASDLGLPVLGSGRFERSTSGQATSSGVVEGVCGVGLRAKHLFGLNLQAVPISSSSNTAYRMEACSADAAEPLH